MPDSDSTRPVHEKTPARILVIRNDKLGDFMLAWPAFSQLKKQYPAATVIALVPSYTAPMAELCPFIDDILIDDRRGSAMRGAVHLAHLIRSTGIDVSISFFSEFRTALAVWLARVPVRIAPATKLAQVFQNRRLRQRRSQSARPEFEYNLELARYCIELNGDTPVTCPPPPYLDIDSRLVNDERSAYCASNGIDPERFLVFVHAGSGGSAVNLSLDQFSSIADDISSHMDAHIVLTAGPGELEHATRLRSMLTTEHCSLYHSTGGLVRFTQFIATCDAFISGSTGPLHIAGALNKPTIGFYPARRSATSLRWRTLSADDRRLAFSPDSYTGERESLDVDIDAVLPEIRDFLQRLQQRRKA